MARKLKSLERNQYVIVSPERLRISGNRGKIDLAHINYARRELGWPELSIEEAQKLFLYTPKEERIVVAGQTLESRTDEQVRELLAHYSSAYFAEGGPLEKFRPVFEKEPKLKKAVFHLAPVWMDTFTTDDKIRGENYEKLFSKTTAKFETYEKVILQFAINVLVEYFRQGGGVLEG